MTREELAQKIVSSVISFNLSNVITIFLAVPIPTPYQLVDLNPSDFTERVKTIVLDSGLMNKSQLKCAYCDIDRVEKIEAEKIIADNCTTVPQSYIEGTHLSYSYTILTTYFNRS